MAFPVSSRSAGYLVTAADWNADLVANVNDLNTRVLLAPQLTQELLVPASGASFAQNPNTTVLLLNHGGVVAAAWGAVVPTRAPWVMYMINISPYAITLINESGSEATPAKRFILPGGVDRTLTLGQGLTFVYVSVPIGARWCAVVGA